MSAGVDVDHQPAPGLSPAPLGESTSAVVSSEDRVYDEDGELEVERMSDSPEMSAVVSSHEEGESAAAAAAAAEANRFAQLAKGPKLDDGGGEGENADKKLSQANCKCEADAAEDTDTVSASPASTHSVTNDPALGSTSTTGTPTALATMNDDSSRTVGVNCARDSEEKGRGLTTEAGASGSSSAGGRVDEQSAEGGEDRHDNSDSVGDREENQAAEHGEDDSDDNDDGDENEDEDADRKEDAALSPLSVPILQSHHSDSETVVPGHSNGTATPPTMRRAHSTGDADEVAEAYALRNGSISSSSQQQRQQLQQEPPQRGSGSAAMLIRRGSSMLRRASRMLITSADEHDHEDGPPPSGPPFRVYLPQNEAAQERLLDQASLKFNLKPKTARDFLMESNVISADPESFAEFICAHHKRLSKRRIGEFVGGDTPLQRATLRHLLTKLDFAGKSLDNALRALLRQFRLPGEAQQIDRILEQFASRFHAQNPSIFSHQDTVYILSFSIIMLNTDLHNRNIPESKKMKVEGFISNNRGIDQGNDLPRDVLIQLYERIRDEEIRMDEGDMYESEVVTFMAPVLAGWLSKKSESIFGHWRQHWFVLTPGCLYYFVTPKDNTPRCIIPLDNTRIGRGSHDTEIVIQSADGSEVKSSKVLKNGIMQRGGHDQFLLRAETTEERDEWLQRLQEEVEKYKPVHVEYQRMRARAQANREQNRSGRSISAESPDAAATSNGLTSSAAPELAAAKETAHRQGGERGRQQRPRSIAGVGTGAGMMHSKTARAVASAAATTAAAATTGADTGDATGSQSERPAPHHTAPDHPHDHIHTDNVAPLYHTVSGTKRFSLTRALQGGAEDSREGGGRTPGVMTATELNAAVDAFFSPQLAHVMLSTVHDPAHGIGSPREGRTPGTAMGGVVGGPDGVVRVGPTFMGDTSLKLPIILEAPIAEGWMRKRGGRNTAWKRRYFCLFADFERQGPTLVYYASREMAQRMIELGEETQKGLLHLKTVRDVHVVQDRAPAREPAIEVVTDDRNWIFCPDNVIQLTEWLRTLSRVCNITPASRASHAGNGERDTSAEDQKESEAVEIAADTK